MLLLSLGLLSTQAHAVDVDTFSVSSSALDGQGGLQLESPTLGWNQAVYGGLGLVYAHAPLVRVYADESVESVVSDSFATRVAAGYTLLSRVRFGVDVPVYPYVGGEAADSKDGFAMGDLHLRAVVGIPLGEDSPVGLAVAPTVSLPTGNTSAYTGSGSVGGGLTAIAGYKVTEALRVDANVGFEATKAGTIDDQALGSALDVGVGGSYALTDAIGVGLELDGSVDLAGGVNWTDNPFEVHAYGRYGKRSGIQATVGVGTGLAGGAGAPDVRVVGMIGYRHAGVEPIYDTDEDGLYDDVDGCIEDPEDQDGFEDGDGCPDPDNDGDGIPDQTDACPGEAEDKDDFHDLDGCPEPDNDQDGLLDADDRCPNEPGPTETGGCPDRDNDRVIDAEDECPDVAGLAEFAGCPDKDNDKVPEPRDRCPEEAIDPREDPTRSDGCPRRVFVSTERIEILEKIYFDTNKATIKSQSFSLLGDVAKVLNDNPDIAQVEVAGHTDSQGNDKTNLKLSQARAESVVKYLATECGVDPARLVAVGYGETRPIDTNSTEVGRGTNRRVEFVIKAVTARPARTRVKTDSATEPATPAPSGASAPPPADPTPAPATPEPAPASPTPAPSSPGGESPSPWGG